MSSNILLVSVNNYNFEKIRAVKTFKNVDFQDVECLIFHSATDSDIELIREFTRMKDIVPKVIYINKNIYPLYYCIFTGLEADIYNSEEFLTDEEMLLYLVDDYKQTDLTMKTADNDLAVLAKSIATISSSSVDVLQKLVSNEYWMRTLSTAVSNVDNAMIMASQININVIDMLDESTKLINDLEENNSRIEDEMHQLINTIKDMDRREVRTNSPFMFAKYTVPLSVPNVLYVKAYGDCRYAKSFLRAYQHYLFIEKRINAKILFAVPNLKMNLVRYQNKATRLAPDTLDFVNFTNEKNFVTFEPKKNILDAFFHQPKVNLFILFDMMLGDKLIDGPKVKEVWALNSVYDVEMFKIPDPKRCIVPIVKGAEMMLIRHIKNYNQSSDQKKLSMYYENHKNEFQQLNSILQIDKR